MARSFVQDVFYAGYIRWKNGTESNIGPYDTPGKAQGQVTGVINSSRRSDIAESGVRKGTVTWEKLDMEAEKKKLAAEKRAMKKQEELDRIESKRNTFFDELNI